MEMETLFWVVVFCTVINLGCAALVVFGRFDVRDEGLREELVDLGIFKEIRTFNSVSDHFRMPLDPKSTVSSENLERLYNILDLIIEDHGYEFENIENESIRLKEKEKSCLQSFCDKLL